MDLRSSLSAPGSDRWLLALCLSRVGTYMVYISYAAALPILQREWHLTATAAGTISSAFQLAYALSLTACSELGDRVGARRVYLLGTVAAFVAAAAFALFARDYWSGLVLNTLLALALGGSYTTGIVLVAENVPPATRGRAMGIYLAGHSLGLALALVLIGIAIPVGGYPLAFGVVSLGPGLGCLVTLATLRRTPNRLPRQERVPPLAGVLRNRPAMLTIAGYVCHSWELLGMWAWTPTFLTVCFVAGGLAFTRAAGSGAYMTSAFHVTGMLSALAAGALSDRFGRAPVIFVMAGLSAACSFAFGWLVGTPIGLVLAVGLVYAFAVLGDSPIYSTLITEVVEPPYRGAALGLRSLLGYGAGAIAPLAFGAIIDARGGTERGAAAWGWAFASLGVAGALAVVCVAVLARSDGIRARGARGRQGNG